MLKLGIIGCGKIVAMHVRHIDRLPVEVTCVMDIVEDKALAMAQRLGCEWTTERAALLARDDVEAVLIATPNCDHADSTLAAVKADKHILCEKPIVRTFEEGVAVVRAGRGAGARRGRVLRHLRLGYDAGAGQGEGLDGGWPRGLGHCGNSRPGRGAREAGRPCGARLRHQLRRLP